MLNIEILKEEKDHMILKVWIPQKHRSCDETFYYNPDMIRKAITSDPKIMKKGVLECVFLKKVSTLVNTLSSDLHEQTVEIKLKLAKKAEKKQKTKKARNKKSES
jgi:hypothetical protein